MRLWWSGQAIAAAVVCLVVGCGGARASGRIDCAVDDSALKLELRGSFSSGVAGGLSGVEGSFELKQAKSRAERGPHSLGNEDVTQYWNRGKDLKLMIARAAGENTAEIAIETERVEDDSETFEGRYRLLVFRPSGSEEHSAPIACEVGY
jgi:hypothetical protein